MKKVKLFFTATFLLLLTLATFAGRARWSTSGLYARSGSSSYTLLTGASLVGLTTTDTGAQCIVTGSGTFGLYTYVTGTGYKPVYSTSLW